MSQTALGGLPQCFGDLHDPRREHGRRDNLWDIIALTICAVTGGADSWGGGEQSRPDKRGSPGTFGAAPGSAAWWEEHEQHGHDKCGWLRTFLDLPSVIPALDPLGRVFALLNPTEFRDGFLRWTAALAAATAGRVISIDGKTL